MREEKEISDFGFIAALIQKGHQPLESFKQGQRVVFVFEWNDYMRGLEEDYFNNSLEVDARSYQRTLRSIKKQIYSMEDR